MTIAWYILTVIPGYGEYVKKEILKKKDLFVENIMLSRAFIDYVFIKIELQTHNLSEFFEIEGAISFLGKKYELRNGKKITIPEEIPFRKITKIFDAIENPKEILISKPNIKFKTGDNVVIKRGDFSDICGKIVDLKKRIVRIQSEFFQNDNKLIKVKIKDIELI
jgi:transcription antitermination factor NusG